MFGMLNKVAHLMGLGYKSEDKHTLAESKSRADDASRKKNLSILRKEILIQLLKMFHQRPQLFKVLNAVLMLICT
jgi:hypothetical protein